MPVLGKYAHKLRKMCMLCIVSVETAALVRQESAVVFLDKAHRAAIDLEIRQALFAPVP